ncbi:Ca2+/calmodulin-dependent protein kinase [Pelomyxa schiedti]|nr:Ca2+/calmodulin-dependent protein kinase [Pelomyxa schiedti]
MKKSGEFQAHEQEVKCLAIGKGSCKVFATASVDTKPDIGVWRLDQSTPGTSLSGKNKPTTGNVTCVSFDPLEEVLMAGLNNGTVLLWDISSQEISRVLTHKARCTATDINPMDEWMCATTGDDSCIRLWDIRASENIETFKAHSGPIGVCRFTPDGVFLVSGGSDGVVALWDIAQRRLFQTLSDHTAPITCMCFHPHEVLLATGAADKSARFWDLETYTQISFTSGPSCVQALTFAPDGHSAVVAFNDSLRVCSWEPMEIKATIQANWTHSHPHRSPLDLCIVKEHIIACTANGSMVTVWSTPIHKVCDMDMAAAEDMSHTNEVLEKVAGPRLKNALDAPEQQQNEDMNSDQREDIAETESSVFSNNNQGLVMLPTSSEWEKHSVPFNNPVAPTPPAMTSITSSPTPIFSPTPTSAASPTPRSQVISTAVKKPTRAPGASQSSSVSRDKPRTAKYSTDYHSAHHSTNSPTTNFIINDNSKRIGNPTPHYQTYKKPTTKKANANNALPH